MKNEELLTDYELSLLKGLKTKQGDVLQAKSIKTTIVNALNGESKQIKLEDGSEQPISFLEEIVAASLKDLKDKPSIEKLATLMKMTDEFKESKVVEISEVDKDLMQRSLGEKDDTSR